MMSIELDRLLILSSDPEFEAKFAALRSDMMQAARFSDADSDQNRTVTEVLRQIGTQGDEAVARYTEKFDQIKRTADQFNRRI